MSSFDEDLETNSSTSTEKTKIGVHQMKKRSRPTDSLLQVPHRDHRNASLDDVYNQINSEVQGTVTTPPRSTWSTECIRMLQILGMCCGVTMLAAIYYGKHTTKTLRGTVFIAPSVSRATSIVDPKTTVQKEFIQLNSFQMGTPQAQTGSLQQYHQPSQGAWVQYNDANYGVYQPMQTQVGNQQVANNLQQYSNSQSWGSQQPGYTPQGQYYPNNWQTQGSYAAQPYDIVQGYQTQTETQTNNMYQQQQQQQQPDINQYIDQGIDQRQKPVLNLYQQQAMLPQQWGQVPTPQVNQQVPVTVVTSERLSIQSEHVQPQQQQIPQQPQEVVTPHAPTALRKYRILTLGGSTTWGSKLDDRFDAYPYVLAKLMGPTWSTVNLAVRATDASYASQCIQTMISEGVPPQDFETNFDVIMLEYSLNGIDGMPLLLKRLRRRYPNAVIIYVHLWSLRMTVDNAKTGEKPRDVLKAGHSFVEADQLINDLLGNKSTEWSWGEAMVADSRQIGTDAMDAVSKVNGNLYELPIPQKPETAFTEHWFGPDYHHLSVSGHHLVASGLADILRTTNQNTGADAKYSAHTWGKGDQCYSWYEHGSHDAVSITGGTMKMFVKPDKWALHVGNQFGQSAKIDFPNTHPDAQPVELVIMSWGPGVYPKVKISLNSLGKPASEQSFLLDPLHPSEKQRVFHVTRTVHIGWAEPGQNQLTIDPIETTERPSRVTGIVMCGACIEMDNTYLSVEAGQGHGALEGATNFLPKHK